jgi:protein-tyrosine-phosphatase
MVQPLPGAVLFACNLNQVRSPMAAALMKQAFGDRVFVDSCGIIPRGEIDPFVAAALGEVGWDLGRHDAQAFDDLEDGSFDMIVCLTPEALARAEAMAKGRATDVEYWPTDDPTIAGGSREQRLEAYRAVREMLRRRIAARFGSPSTMTG